jgi:hypothetical protein
MLILKGSGFNIFGERIGFSRKRNADCKAIYWKNTMVYDYLVGFKFIYLVTLMAFNSNWNNTFME